MNEMRLEPPNSAPSPPPLPHKPDRSAGSLAAGVGLAWAIMLVGESLVMLTNNISALLGGILLPPLAIIVCGVILLNGNKPRTGKGMFLGLLSIVAVVLLLVAACFGMMSNFR